MTAKAKKKNQGGKGTKKPHGKINPERLNLVAQLLLRRYSRSQICDELATSVKAGGLGLSRKQIRRYCDRVEEEWRRANLGRTDAQRAEESGRIRATFELAVQENIELATGDAQAGKRGNPKAWREVITANRELARMNGDYKERVEVTGAGGGPIETSNMSGDEALLKLKMAGRALQRAGTPGGKQG